MVSVTNLKIEAYIISTCPFCIKAQKLLKLRGLEYLIKEVSRDADLKKEMIERSLKKSVPEIFINDFFIGGCDELHHLDEILRLDKLNDEDTYDVNKFLSKNGYNERPLN